MYLVLILSFTCSGCQSQQRRALRESILGDNVDVESFSAVERSVLAEREKQKGNECFKAGDAEEAETFYSRSLALDPDNSIVWSDCRMQFCFVLVVR